MLSDISKILNFDLKGFFERYLDFINNDNQELVNYYTLESEYPKESFDKLDRLFSDCRTIYEKIKIFRNNLENYYGFLVFDQVEDCYHTLNIIENYNKWFRTSFLKGRFKSTVEVDFVLKKNQTLENLSEEIGFEDRERGALELSIRNHIKETDYALDGGLVFKFSYQNDESLYLNTVVDVLTGENVLGKDIDKKFIFRENDLLTLSPKETFVQTCSILCGLLKNNNPEFPTQGFDKRTLSNKNVLNSTLPTFIRQLYSTVGRDDTIASFEIINIKIEGDCLRIEIEFKSLLEGRVTKQTINGN